ncbi:hypothetical protein EON66_07245 [archaeon]|nr:MAG: hypothetical protein EON66_07245 [archaeon]
MLTRECVQRQAEARATTFFTTTLHSGATARWHNSFPLGHNVHSTLWLTDALHSAARRAHAAAAVTLTKPRFKRCC